MVDVVNIILIGEIMEQNNWQEIIGALAFVVLFIALWVVGSYYFHPENTGKRATKINSNSVIVHEPAPIRML